MQPRQRSQFFIIRSNPVYNHPIGGKGSRRGPNGMMLVMGQLMTVVTVVAAGAATAGDDQVVADGAGAGAAAV